MLKMVRTARSRRTGTTKRVAWWCAGANMKPNPASLDALRDLCRPEVDAGAEGLEQVRRARAARGRAVAVLGDGAASPGGDQRGGGGDVERAAPASGARRVDKVGSIYGNVRGKLSHRAGETGDLLHRLPLRPQGDEKAGYLGLGDLPVHDLCEDVRGLLRGQVLARGELVDRPGEGGVRHVHGVGRPSQPGAPSRKFCSRSLP